MARLIELKQTAPERFLARFDTGEELRTTLAVVTDFHLRSGKELTSQELDALRAASERSRCRQRALRIIGARAMSVKELTDRLKEKGESPENAEDAAAWLQEMHLLDDAQYAAMCVRHYAAKGYGAGRIRHAAAPPPAQRHARPRRAAPRIGLSLPPRLRARRDPRGHRALSG